MTDAFHEGEVHPRATAGDVYRCDCGNEVPAAWFEQTMNGTHGAVAVRPVGLLLCLNHPNPLPMTRHSS